MGRRAVTGREGPQLGSDRSPSPSAPAATALRRERIASNFGTDGNTFFIEITPRQASPQPGRLRSSNQLPDATAERLLYHALCLGKPVRPALRADVEALGVDELYVGNADEPE